LSRGEFCKTIHSKTGIARYSRHEHKQRGGRGR
jgi:hypothetical protein